jgi:hypothetical protein
MSRLDCVQAFRRIPSKRRLRASCHPAVAFRRNTVASQRKPVACKTLAGAARFERSGETTSNEHVVFVGGLPPAERHIKAGLARLANEPAIIDSVPWFDGYRAGDTVGFPVGIGRARGKRISPADKKLSGGPRQGRTPKPGLDRNPRRPRGTRQRPPTRQRRNGPPASSPRRAPDPRPLGGSVGPLTCTAAWGSSSRWNAHSKRGAKRVALRELPCHTANRRAYDREVIDAHG